MRRSGCIVLVLIGSSLAALGYHGARRQAASEAAEGGGDSESDPTATQPSYDPFRHSYSYYHTYHHYGSTLGDDYRGRSSSGSRSVSSSSTSRGGFGSHGHASS